MCRRCGETVDHSLLHCVGRLIVYGVLSLELLGFHGFSQDRLKISFLVGGIGWGSTHLTIGI